MSRTLSNLVGCVRARQRLTFPGQEPSAPQTSRNSKTVQCSSAQSTGFSTTTPPAEYS
ncbi:hypothetical protein RGUI_1742 [Rhodovulum sp. P5]|nr:hypothetical protein RGUI_1742 [Rhodovulum sp. P5]